MDPVSPTINRKRKVVPVDQIVEWLHLFMTNAAIRPEKYPEEGRQLTKHCVDQHFQIWPQRESE